MVGVNRYRSEQEPEVPINRLDPKLEAQQVERLWALRANRNQVAVDAALADLRAAAETSDCNVLEPMRTALAAHASVGEVCGLLRTVWGEHDR